MLDGLLQLLTAVGVSALVVGVVCLYSFVLCHFDNGGTLTH